MKFDLLKSPSGVEDGYLWADYIEIACMINIDNIQSSEDIYDKIARSRRLSVEDNNTIDSLGSTKKDKWMLKISEYFSHITYRVEEFGEFYPFFTDEGGNICLHADLTLKHRIYLYFLISFNLKYFTREEIQVITRSFEIISFEAFKKIFPVGAEVHIFGTSRAAGGRYVGNPLERVTKLAEDINEKLITEDFPSTGGDEGLDLIGYVPFKDKNPGYIIAFAQCACSQDEWARKQSSSSYEEWRHKITFKSPPMNLVFIPGCYRKSNGEWHSMAKVRSVLIDRLRFIRILGESENLLENLESHQILLRAIAFKEEAI